jgi:hypothetical protein
MHEIPLTDLSAALTYNQFRTMAREEVETGVSSDHPGAEALLAYTRQNLQRMQRWDRTLTLEDSVLERLRLLDRPVLMLTLAESWCGDVSQVVPVLEKMAQASDMLELRLLLRDQHPHIMDAFLTNGARAIPKVIFVDPSNRHVLGAWGPRPSETQAMVMDIKASEVLLPESERADFRRQAIEAVHSWYAKDKGRRTALECSRALWEAIGSGQRARG